MCRALPAYLCLYMYLSVCVHLCAGAPGKGIPTAVVPHLVPLLRFVRFPLMSPEHLVLHRVMHVSSSSYDMHLVLHRVF